MTFWLLNIYVGVFSYQWTGLLQNVFEVWYISSNWLSSSEYIVFVNTFYITLHDSPFLHIPVHQRMYVMYYNVLQYMIIYYILYIVIYYKLYDSFRRPNSRKQTSPFHVLFPCNILKVRRTSRNTNPGRGFNPAEWTSTLQGTASALSTTKREGRVKSGPDVIIVLHTERAYRGSSSYRFSSSL